MADVNVQKRQEERGRDQRSQGLARRGQGGFPSLWNRPDELFAMSPFTLMRRLTEDMDRMFGGFGGGQQQEIGAFAPPVEVREENGNLIVTAELPGLNKEDVKIEVNNDSLVIEGERKREWDENRGGVHRSERFYGTFYRQIALPEGASVEQAKAEFNNGVLEIRVPVPQQAQKTRQIPIEGGTERKRATSAAGQQTQQSKAG
jgi:HSP20 family protein